MHMNSLLALSKDLYLRNKLLGILFRPSEVLLIGTQSMVPSEYRLWPVQEFWFRWARIGSKRSGNRANRSGFIAWRMKPKTRVRSCRWF
jgi:hypothetical protein